MIIDNRYHFRLTPEQFTTLPAPEAFILKRPLIKEPATEESEAVFYTAADELTIEQAINLHYAQTGSGKRQVQYMDESGDKPQLVEDMEECDRVTFSIWGVYGSELRAFIEVIDSLGENPDEIIIPSGKTWSDYLSNNILPIE